MDDEAVAFAYERKHVQPGTAIGIVSKDWFTSVAPRGDMVEGAGKFESEWSRHTGNGTE
jgi:hypothetical protein